MAWSTHIYMYIVYIFFSVSETKLFFFFAMEFEIIFFLICENNDDSRII